MKFIGDYHLHTYASDGRASIADHVDAAKKRGLTQIAVTDHSFSSLLYHMTQKKFDEQENAIKSLDGCGVKIFHGIEANLIGGRLDVPHSVLRRCDILTAGFHRFISPCRMDGQSRFLLVNGFGSRAEKEKLIMSNTEAYVDVIENYPVDVIAHLCHRAPVDVARVCDCAARHGVYIELNAKHLDALAEGIEYAVASGVRFIVGSDAHRADRTGRFEDIESFINKYGVPMDRVFGINGNEPTFKDKKEWVYGRDV